LEVFVRRPPQFAAPSAADVDRPGVRVAQHVAGCADCQARLDGLRETAFAIRALPIPELVIRFGLRTTAIVNSPKNSRIGTSRNVL